MTRPEDHERLAKEHLAASAKCVPPRSSVRDAVLGDSNALLAICGYLREIRDLSTVPRAEQPVEFSGDERGLRE